VLVVYDDDMLALRKRHVFVSLFIFAVLSLVPAYLHAYTIIGASEIPTVLLRDKIIVSNFAYSLKLPYSNIKLVHQRGEISFTCVSRTTLA
jgi:signal peptidase I